jgi:WD40 repeat protein
MGAFEIFFSYNSADRTSVVAIQNVLKARGISMFLDRDTLVAGLPWPQALEEGLRGVLGVAVFIGRELGGWQKREMWFALDRQVREEKQGRAFPVIPVLLHGADLTTGFLFTNTWIDLRDGLDGVLAAEALDAFQRTIDNTQPNRVLERAAAICPYRGLQVFREEDGAFFFGRSAVADRLLHFTLNKNLVALVGPSGSGKSSVVQAGLLPRLGRERPPANTWDAVGFTPGKEPFHRLAAALIPLLEPEKDEVERLAEAQRLGALLADSQTRIESVINRVIEKSRGTGRLLLIADQFEELFTLTPESTRQPFVQALVCALGNAPYTLLITLRADFYSQIITLDRGMSDRLAPAQVNVGALTPDELRESITAPARLVGLQFEPGLVERILTDVGTEPGRLPLVEFALSEVWQRRQQNLLTNSAYAEIGGVTGALARRAEAEFAQLSPDEQAAACRLFSRLVRVAKPEESGDDTRQRSDLSDSDPLTKLVARRLADARLLVTGNDSMAGTLSVEVAHEALIRNWDRLRSWVNEDREFLLWRQRLQVRIDEWARHGQDAEYLLRGTPLSEAERWFLARAQDLADTEQRFTRNSIALRERDQENEEQRRQAEIENAKRLKEAAESKASVLRRSLLALAGLLVLALVLTGIALWQRAVARARELVAASLLIEQGDPELSVLTAAQAVATTWRWGHSVLPVAEEQLHRSILTSHVRATLSGHTSYVFTVSWSPDGKRLATGSQDGTVRVWHAETAKVLLTLPGDSSIETVAWNPDGRRLATGSYDGTARVWDTEIGKKLLTISGGASVAWSPDWRYLATVGWDNTAKVWNAETGKQLLSINRRGNSLGVMAWSPNGKRLAIVDESKNVKVWDGLTGQESLVISGNDADVRSVAWSPDGKRLATGSDDKTAKVWDTQTGNELSTLLGHQGVVNVVAWSPDGKWLATGSDDKTAKIWNATTGEELPILSGHSNWIISVAWRPDGKRLATGSDDKTVKTWDAMSGEALLTIRGHDSGVQRVAWSPDGKRLATASGDNTAKVWDAQDGRELLTLRHVRVVQSVAWSPDGKRLATASADHTAKVWNATNGDVVFTARHELALRSVAWSPDGARLATSGDDHTAKIWDAENRRELLTLSGHEGYVHSVAWSPNGKRLATGSWDYTAKVWDAGSGKELLTMTGHNARVFSVAWSPDGKRLATGSDDKTVKVWDAENGQELLSLNAHNTPVFSVEWSPDGRRLASAGEEEVQVYTMDICNLMALARQRVTAYPSAEGCKKFLHLNKCPSIPELSLW